jgi:LmbE family N-acetylglucosaminyl deacetylase
MKPLFSHNRYVSVYAHPDDESHTVVTNRQLVRDGKDLHALYLTNGDYDGPAMAIRRQGEVEQSLAQQGIEADHVQKLGLPERTLFDQADEAVRGTIAYLEAVEPDCVIGHDYEGGHTAHDLASFCAYLGARSLGVPFWVFPAYHGLPGEERMWNRFVPGRTEDFIHVITRPERAFKQSIIDTHASQKKFFDTMLESSSAPQVLGREVLRYAADIDYRSKPTDPLGYELPGSTGRFEALQAIFDRHLPVEKT